MSGAGSFEVDPWAVPERTLDLDLLAQTESVFALSNGHIGLRGNLDEGEPARHPGTYLNGLYETRPLPYAEVALADDQRPRVLGYWAAATAAFHINAGLRLPRGDRVHQPARPPSTRRTASTSRPWPGRGSSRSRASAACATTAACWSSRRGCRRS